MTNLGYDGHHSPQHDYDLPPSVEHVSLLTTYLRDYSMDSKVIASMDHLPFSSGHRLMACPLTINDIAAMQSHQIRQLCHREGW